MPAPNTILQNRYLIREQFGEGGMGTVYEALDQRVSCLVALKETKKTLAGSMEARRDFEREAALLANLRHPSLPKVMDYFSEGDGDFLVMEYIPGYDLAELLDLRGSPFTQSQVLRWADELLKVLEYLHGQQPPILHRDIKPSNLKLTKQGEIFLLDFGLAKGAAGQMSAVQTNRSVPRFTWFFAPLEQIHGQGTDARSDLYSLSATLYHLLTNVLPTNAAARFTAIEDEQADPLQRIEKLNPHVSSNVAAVIHQAMAISKKQRPVSATEMRKALRYAAEEDERNALEEEYQRAEVKRQQRQEEARQRQEAETLGAQAETSPQEAERLKREEEDTQRAEAARQSEDSRRAEEKRLQAEAEDRRRVEEAVEARRAEAERQFREEESERQKREIETAARIRAEEERQRAGISDTIPSPTVQAQESHTVGDSQAKTDIKTWEAPPPEKLFKINQRDSNAAFTPAGVSTSNRHTGSKRVAVMMIVGVLAVIIIGGLALMKRGTAPQKQTTGETQSPPILQPQPDLQPQANPPVSQAENKPTPPASMAYVPGGTFMMGRDDVSDPYERPAHKVTVKPFFIDIYEVTNEDYAKFVKATNSLPPTTWTKGTYPAGAARKPVTGVKWDDASAYAKWAGKRLPTEEEWEFAARGTEGRRYPWGNDWRTGLANADGATSGMVVVGAYKGASSFGAFDMVGNAWEWTGSNLTPYPSGSLPVKVSDDLKVIRGGAYSSNRKQATTTYRRGWRANAESDYSNTGFRCVKDIGES